MISTGDAARGAEAATTPALERGAGRGFRKGERGSRAMPYGDRRNRFDARADSAENGRIDVILRPLNENRARRNLPLHEREQFGKVRNRTEPFAERFRIFSRRLVENR